MVEAVPLEQDEPGLDVDLLDDRVEHHGVLGVVDLSRHSRPPDTRSQIRAVPCGVSLELV